MDNIYSLIRKIAKSIKMQNLFVASKEIAGIRLFRNQYDFSKLQEIFLSYLYSYDSLNRDIIIDGISKKVIDEEIYEDAYLYYKKSNKYKENQKKRETNPDKQRKSNLTIGKKIIFPDKKEV